jgi:hypothetical protein
MRKLGIMLIASVASVALLGGCKSAGQHWQQSELVTASVNTAPDAAWCNTARQTRARTAADAEAGEPGADRDLAYLDRRLGQCPRNPR